jgi:predicted metal-binding membrane protein
LKDLGPDAMIARMPLPRPVAVSAALLGGALAAWIVAYDRMHGMGGRPTDLGWYLGLWVTMTAAMMLPAAAPMVLVFSRVSRDRARHHRLAAAPTWVFVAGYLVAWSLYGLIAYGFEREARSAAPHLLAWGQGGRYVAAAALVAAGLYELTPLKEVCLRRCRGPINFMHAGWRDGPAGALRMGAEHGLYCVGCCLGLMLALFALGVMSLTWMAAIAVVIFVQKVLPLGDRLAPVISAALVALAMWVVAAA